jgi:hypothetical protein
MDKLKAIFLSVLTGLLILFTSDAMATTYYLLADGTNADPDCSESSACCAGAMDMTDFNAASFSPGDTIKVCDDSGVFRAQMIVPSSGSDGSPITIEAADGDSPIINGADVIAASFSVQDVGSEIFTSANALANSANEADATTDLTNVGFATFASATKGDEPDGSYSLHVVADTNGDKAYTSGISVSTGVTYEVSYFYVVTNGDVNSKIGFKVKKDVYTGDNLYVSEDLLATSWTQVTGYFTATSSTVVFNIEEQGSGNDCDAYVTGLSIKPVVSWTKNIGSTEPYRIIFNDNQIGTSVVTPAADYEYNYSDPNLVVYATSDPDSYYTSINATQRICIDFNDKNYITVDGISAKYGQQYAIDTRGSTNISLKNMTNDDVQVAVNDDSVSIETSTFDRVGDGYAGAFVFLNNGCQNFSSLNNTYTDGNGIQVNACSGFTITGDTFDGETAGSARDDMIALKASGGDTEDGVISGVNVSHSTAIVSIGSAVGAGLKVEDIDISDCHLTEDGWSLLFIKPGIVGGATGGGIINNISMTDCDLTTQTGRPVSGAVDIDSDANDGTVITNISVDDVQAVFSTDAGAGTSAFIRVKMGTDSLDGLNITNSSFTHNDAGGTRADYSIQVDADSSDTQNILISGVTFDGSNYGIQDDGGTFTDPVEIKYSYFDNIQSDFGSSFDAPVYLVSSIINGNATLLGSGYSFWNVTINGDIVVDDDVTLYNTYGDSLDIADTKTVSGTHNAFAAASITGTGTYSDSTYTQWNINPLFTDTTPGSEDFTLQITSPCIDAGVGISGYGDKLRIDSTWPDGVETVPCGNGCDIGAYEYPRWGGF